MTTTLIVLAHPDGASFNRAWAEATARAAGEQGHRVLWSDLHAMRFDPVETASHYGEVGAPFDVLKAQAAAYEAGSLPADVAGEIDKVLAADRLVFHFPLWWFAPPAMLKGWCERVLVNGGLHDTDRRFDTGVMRGKRALFCATTGATAAESGSDGKEGDTRMLLWPLAQTLRYLGIDVLEPEIVHGVHGYHKGAGKAALEARLEAVLAAQAGLVAGLDDRPAIRFNSDGDFDQDGRLKPGVESVTPFIRHPR